MAITVLTDRGRTLSLGRRLGNGSEGAVYEIQGAPEHLAKVLLAPADPAREARRLTSLVLAGRSVRTASLLALPHQSGTPRRAAWPIATITIQKHEYAGFVMHDMRRYFRPLGCLLSGGSRREHFPADPADPADPQARQEGCWPPVGYPESVRALAQYRGRGLRYVP